MRQGQQNRRGRGRSNRKGQSPLTRSFESTGPEVKIRGTPSHIAEKYMSLARDATSTGDPVLAENYLQHAEHYNRIIMAFRDQQIAQGGDGLNGGTMARNPMDNDDFGDDDGDDGDMQPQMGNDHQPRMDNQRYEGNRGGQDQNRHRGDREHHRNFNNNNNNNTTGTIAATTATTGMIATIAVPVTIAMTATTAAPISSMRSRRVSLLPRASKRQVGSRSPVATSAAAIASRSSSTSSPSSCAGRFAVRAGKAPLQRPTGPPPPTRAISTETYRFILFTA